MHKKKKKKIRNITLKNASNALKFSIPTTGVIWTAAVGNGDGYGTYMIGYNSICHIDAVHIGVADFSFVFYFDSAILGENKN